MVKRWSAIKKRRVISPAAIAAWQAGDERALYFALNLRPWHPSPLCVDENAPPPTPRPGNAWTEDWPQIQELRREMIRVAGQPPATKKENIDGDY